MAAIRLRPLIDELRIIDKKGRMVRFGDVINPPQADLIADAELQLATTGQIRTIILKARQMGLSTAVEAILFVLTMTQENFGTLIMSHENDSAEHILSMTNTYWTTFAFRRHYKTKRDAVNTLSWVHGGSMRVATAGGKKTKGRSKTIRGLHGSEVAFWEDPETLWTGLRNSIPTLEGAVTAIFMESTANGVGNFFHKQWNDAVAGRSEYTAKFYPWHEYPEYTADHLPQHLRTKYAQLGPLDDEEKTLVERFGLDAGRLAWRRYAIQNLCTGKDVRGRSQRVSGIDQFHQEYPADPHEAFISTGRNVFNLPKLLKHYDPWVGTRGNLSRDPSDRVKFTEDDQNGVLTIFRHPSPDENWGLYRIGGDPTHTVAGDDACAQVIHRRTLEQVAVIRMKATPMAFAEQLELLGYYYNTATIAPEREGPGYATIGVLTGRNYPRIWQSVPIDKAAGHVTDTYGWSTNVATKHHAVQTLVQLINDTVVQIGAHKHGLVIHDKQTLTEMRDYRVTEDGRGYENGDGSPYDDGVMALAIAITTHLIDIDEVPMYETPDRGNVAQKLAASGARTRDSIPTTPGQRHVQVVPDLAAPVRDGIPRHSFHDPIAPAAPTDPVANFLDETDLDDFGLS
jgi:hypothetical protein